MKGISIERLNLIGLFFLEEKLRCLFIILFRCTGYYYGQQESFQLVTSILFRTDILKIWSPDQRHQHHYHLGICEKCKFLGPTPELLRQKQYRWSTETGLTNLPGDSDAH